MIAWSHRLIHCLLVPRRRRRLRCVASRLSPHQFEANFVICSAPHKRCIQSRGQDCISWILLSRTCCWGTASVAAGSLPGSWMQ